MTGAGTARRLSGAERVGRDAVAETALVLAGLLVLVTGVRVGLAAAALRGSRPAGGSGVHGRAGHEVAGHDVARHDAARHDVTVLQAIRSGDPLMPGHLRENLAHQPGARFVWLVDEDDPAGRAAARVAARGAEDRVQVVVVPPLPAGRNPKVFKLVLGLPLAGELVAVLDDDTVLVPGALDRACAALAGGDVVTGVPVYREQGSLWSRLVAAFVNGSSLVTYLPLAVVTPPVTLNGMFYVTRRAVLEELGGFAAIEDRLCDDYELALLYRRAGLTVVQAPVVHPLATTVPTARAYGRIMRRWMVFAGQVLRSDLSPAMVGLVVVPSVLPAVAMLVAVLSGDVFAVVVVLAALLGKAAATALLRRHAGAPASLAGALLEPVSDLLLPVHLLGALLRPHRVTWRGREIDVRPGVLARGGGQA